MKPSGLPDQNSSDRNSIPIPPGSIFETTRWSIIARAREFGDSGAEALEFLCRAYWNPIRAYLLRSGFSFADAEDLTQEFFSRLLRREGFSKLSPERGRFRNFLLVSLRNFLSDEHDKGKALRRGSGVAPVSLDALANEGSAFEIADPLTPEQVFERHWAETALARAREKLKAEFAASQRLNVYEALGPEGNDSSETYQEIGVRLGLSEDGVKAAAFRLRRRYRELIRQEVAETVDSEAELESELRHLIRVLEK